MATLGLTLLLGAGAIFGYFLHQFKQPLAFSQDVIITIPQGSSARSIDFILSRSAIHSPENYFHLGLRFHQNASQMKAGEFLIPAQSSLFNIMNIIKAGKTHQYQITIAEGLTSFEITQLLNQENRLSGEVRTLPQEGRLLPESYFFSRGYSRENLIKRMQQDFTKAINTLWQTRQDNLPFDTKEEAIILASIVEKETGIARERADVAGVFINRLKKGIPLQSDPTVIYAVTRGKKTLDRPIYKSDLKKQSPYNTYFVRGLPPGPISNPGRKSLEAVLNPTNHNYYYFVADGSGGHAFSKTLKEHNQNVSKWRKIERQRKQK